jgi:hypothetical protein
VSLHRARSTNGGATAQVLRARADNLPEGIEQLPRYEAYGDALGHGVRVLAWPSGQLLTRAQWTSIRTELAATSAAVIERGRNGKPLRLTLAEAVCAQLLEHELIAIASVRVDDPEVPDAG